MAMHLGYVFDHFLIHVSHGWEFYVLLKASGWGGSWFKIGRQLRAYPLAFQLCHHSSCAISHDWDLMFVSCWDDSFVCQSRAYRLAVQLCHATIDRGIGHHA